jgi:hypothetical protein
MKHSKCKPNQEEDTHSDRWATLGVQPTRSQPGQFAPPPIPRLWGRPTGAFGTLSHAPWLAAPKAEGPEPAKLARGLPRIPPPNVDGV